MKDITAFFFSKLLQVSDLQGVSTKYTHSQDCGSIKANTSYYATNGFDQT